MFVKHPSHQAPHRRLRGASLIEALVALTVLAFGVLGIAGLQTRTLLESRASNARAVAVRLAADLNERIRANPGAHLADPSGSARLYLMDWDTPAQTTDCGSAACTATQLARYDLMQWKASLSQGLPGGDARVFVSPTDPGMVAVLIGWPLIPERALNSASGSSAPSPTPAWDVAPGVTDVPCKPGLMCHLVWIRP